MINLKNKKFIYLIRFIGYTILIFIAIDIIFFQHKYISQTFIGNGLSAGIAVIMTQYKIDYEKKSFKENIGAIFIILLISSILYYFWYKG